MLLLKSPNIFLFYSTPPFLPPPPFLLHLVPTYIFYGVPDGHTYSSIPLSGGVVLGENTLPPAPPPLSSVYVSVTSSTSSSFPNSVTIVTASFGVATAVYVIYQVSTLSSLASLSLVDLMSTDVFFR